MALPRAAVGTVLAPGTSSFGWKAPKEDLSKYFAPALSWESGSHQDKLSVKSQEWLGKVGRN